MSSRAGFTILEVTAGMAISTVLAGSVLTMLHLNNERILESMALSKLTMLHSVAADEVHRVARNAYTVTADGNPFDASTTAPIPGLSEVTFYDRDRNIVGGFRNSGGTLEEWSGGAYQAFTIGPETVHLTSTGNFSIGTDRRSISFDFDLSMPYHGQTYLLTNPTETVLCRNTPN